jgi:hypothetical protein
MEDEIPGRSGGIDPLDQALVGQSCIVDPICRECELRHTQIS